jgi:signal transduction histidine kinase
VEAVDVNLTLDNSLVLVAHLLTHTRIQVVRSFEATTLAGINQQELQRVVINLLINAIQAMPEGGTLLLRTRNHTDSQGKSGVAIEIADTGARLTATVHDRLFRPFFTTKNEGNGLGLWISLGLVERYGGSIRAFNRRDQGEDLPGALFSVWLLADPEPQERSA